VEKLFQRYAAGGDKRMGIACWQLLFYALWHRIHAEVDRAEGSVFDCLGAA
jgi:hypothetical protein